MTRYCCVLYDARGENLTLTDLIILNSVLRTLVTHTPFHFQPPFLSYLHLTGKLSLSLSLSLTHTHTQLLVFRAANIL